LTETASPPRPWAVLSALAEEIAPLERSVAGGRRAQAGDGSSWLEGSLAGRPVVLASTGMGADRARAAAERIFAAVRPRAVIAIGYAGGLRDGLDAGDLVVGDEVMEAETPGGGAPRSWRADADLLARARGLAVPGLRVVEGRIVTAREVAGSPAQKRVLGGRGGAAVEMESSGIAGAAAAAGVPALCVRAILDEAGYEIPQAFTRLLGPDGRVRPLAALGRLLLNPAAVRAIPELRRRSQAASAALARFVEALVAAEPLR